MPLGGIFGRGRRGRTNRQPSSRREPRREYDPYGKDPNMDSREGSRFPPPSDDPRHQGGSRAPTSRGGKPGMRINPRLLIFLLIAGFFAFKYFVLDRNQNEITGEVQRVSLTPEQEVQLGLQAAPQMAAQHGGVHPDPRAVQHLRDIGQRLVAAMPELKKYPYQWNFTLLADPRTVNAFALPGGQIYMTYALYGNLRTEAEVAGVLGHEIGHVAHRHGAEQMSRGSFLQGLAGATGVLTGSEGGANMAKFVANFVGLRYGREAEIESDVWGVKNMVEAGYDPRALIEVMNVLEKASGGKAPPAMLSTHPHPEKRRATIKATIEEMFPDGVPAHLER